MFETRCWTAPVILWLYNAEADGTFNLKLPTLHAPPTGEKQKEYLVTSHGVAFDF
jgi:hypothetical protein